MFLRTSTWFLNKLIQQRRQHSKSDSGVLSRIALCLKANDNVLGIYHCSATEDERCGFSGGEVISIGGIHDNHCSRWRESCRMQALSPKDILGDWRLSCGGGAPRQTISY